MLNKQDAKFLLNVCKPFIKLNFFFKNYNVSQSAVSRFMNYDKFDEMISNDKLNSLLGEIYSSCKLFTDLYDEAEKIE